VIKHSLKVSEVYFSSLVHLNTNELTLWSWVLLERPPVVQPLDNFPAFREPKGSLPQSQELFICPYPEPDQSNPHHPILSTRFILMSSLTYILVFLVVSFPLPLLTITYTCSSSPPFMLHALTISSSFTL
jgi:hypothetical protein